MSSSLLNLPNELLVAVIGNLSLTDLLRCELVCKPLLSLIKNSSELQYSIAIEQAGYDDVPSSSFGIPEKMDNLKQARDSWTNLRSQFVKEVEVKHHPSGIYDLAGGVYLLGEETRHTLYWLTLPELEADLIEWKSLTVDESIIDMGLGVDEHDLIAVITTKPLDTEPASYEIAMHLRKFSTGDLYPDARNHRIVINRSDHQWPAIGIEIVGANLIIILSYSRIRAQQPPEDRLFVYEWKTGKLKMSLVAPHRSYTGPIFLTEHVFLLPNTKKGVLEIWDIPRMASEPSPSDPRCSLALPNLAPGRIFSSISCRGEPNPVGEVSRPGSKTRRRPYQPNADNAIMIFNVSVDPSLNRFGIGLGHTYSFFVHRKSIIKVVEDLGTYSSTSASIGSLPPTKLPVESPPIDIHFPTPLGDAALVTVPWGEWGPQCTRWFEVDRLPTRWITTTAGQRAVLMSRESDEGTRIMVLDFNQWSVKRAAWDEYQRKQLKEAVARQKAERRADSDGKGKGKMVAGGCRMVPENCSAEVPAAETFSQEDRTISVLDTANNEPPTNDQDPDLDMNLPPLADPGPVDYASDWEGEWVDVDEDEDDEDDGLMIQDAQPFTMEALQNIHPGFLQLLLGQNAVAGQDIQDIQAVITGGPGGTLGYLGELMGSLPGMLDGLEGTDDDGETDDDADGWRSNNGAENERGGRHRRTRTTVVTRPNQVDKFGRSFESPIVSELPFVQYASKHKPSYDGVLMDEERILGILTDQMDVIKRVDVHYFG